ncbi:hypothetical protein [Elizabethkingia anophelis]|uniref:hypothetical protein n=1 Tax=Elizabethkingia anophelis TaxID=1117645 RepID=UPI003891F8D7
MNIQPLQIDSVPEIDLNIIDISQFKVYPDVEIPKPTPILSVKEFGKHVDIFTEGNISMIQGQAKSRKSTFIRSISQAILNGENSKLISNYRRNKMAIIDTEQSNYDSYRSVRMIKELTHTSIDYYNVAEIDKEKRKYLVEEHLRSNPDCGFIILDNIVHFLSNFNDPVESAELLQWLIKIKVSYNVHICVVLHENSSVGGGNKARGHLGTNLVQMCETVISIQKDTNDKTRSIITAKETRGMDFEPFTIQTDYQGVPYLSDLEKYDKEYL